MYVFMYVCMYVCIHKYTCERMCVSAHSLQMLVWPLMFLYSHQFKARSLLVSYGRV